MDLTLFLILLGFGPVTMFFLYEGFRTMRYYNNLPSVVAQLEVRAKLAETKAALYKTALDNPMNR